MQYLLLNKNFESMLFPVNGSVNLQQLQNVIHMMTKPSHALAKTTTYDSFEAAVADVPNSIHKDNCLIIGYEIGSKTSLSVHAYTHESTVERYSYSSANITSTAAADMPAPKADDAGKSETRRCRIM